MTDPNQSIFGDAGNNSLTGGSGNDFIAGGDGHDTLIGGFSDDDLRGDGGKTRSLAGFATTFCQAVQAMTRFLANKATI